MPQPPHPADDAPEPTPRRGTAVEPGPSPSPSGSDTDSDAGLIARLRAGDDSVVGTLFERHHRAALGYARSLGGMDHRSEDLASEAFVRTLAAVRAGSGPTDNWRPYLLTVVRNTAAAWATSDRRSFPTDDVQDWADEADHAPSPDQIVAASTEHELIVTAYRSLPERWRSVLWHSVVERRPTEEVASLLGLSASGLSSLAARAREGLRTAYLSAHLSTAQSAECQVYASQLTARVRGTSQRRPKALTRHLDECPACRRCDEELQDVNRRLRLAAVAFIGPWSGGEASVPTLAPHTGSGHPPAPQPQHAPPSTPRTGTGTSTGKAVAGALTAGATVVAAIALTPYLASPQPEQPAGARPPVLSSTPADGAASRPAVPADPTPATVPVLPVASSPTSPPAHDRATRAPDAPASPATAAPPSPTTRTGSPSATTKPPGSVAATGRGGGLSASVYSASTPPATLPGDRRVRLRLAATGNCGEVEDSESTAGLPYLMPCEASDYQLWIVRADRSGGTRLISAVNGACLESAGTVGAVVSQQTCGENARQSWQVVDLTGGESALRHRASGLLLASQGTGKVDETLRLRSADCDTDPVCRPSTAFRL
ncbi:sigma-70 family RNA polymerase sigma factor [Streptomyces sp. BE20]|uniref:sigma-70 family RNA polymerase sigma factor n=1 Tax=Streptomyces sp. BE20 TaxID=3002525 RepID=UPI002E794B83|nr:sigma-70 family RNA polymerase sigma factor [Streptomyces sp. BE20]MEE1827356.1 sigma-70 family RNA polymerase sigma factor [Streptomyces sp. BE20]